MKTVFITLSPILILILFGILLTWRGLLKVDQIRDLTKLVFWIGLPALIIDKLSVAEVAGGDVLRLVLVFFGATVGAILLAIVSCWVLKLKRLDCGTFIQGSFRGNLAFVGLPILVYLLEGQGEERVTEVVALAMLSFAPTMLLYNGVSIVALQWSRQQSGESALPQALKEIAKNPLILASLIGRVAS
jgi:hypothetical protein